MSFTQDLLDQADHLASFESTKPKQASLRRAVSSAYYALFHLLVEEGASELVANPELRHLVRRAFDHGEMKDAAKSFSSGNLPSNLAATFGAVVPSDLQDVARAFITLQEARHDADYNLTVRFYRTTAQDYLRQAHCAIDAWNRVKSQPLAKVFLAALLLKKKWDRRTP